MTLEQLLSRAPGHYAVYAKNLNTGHIVSLEEHAIFPSASLIKVPILVELYRRVEEEHLSLDHLVTMQEEDQVGGSGVLMDLTPGTAYALRDLATLMITVSDNTATNLLIDFLGVDAVNTNLQRLGVLNTALARRLQRVPVERPTTNHTTAYDMSRMMELLARGEAISEDVSARMVDILKRCQASVSISRTADSGPHVGQPAPITVAHKTGSLSHARHDSGIVYTPKGAYVATILSDGAPESTLAPVLAQLGRHLRSWMGA